VALTGNKVTENVVPDFARIVEGELELTLTDEMHLVSMFLKIIRKWCKPIKHLQIRTSKDAVQFIKQKIDSAKWFIDAIRQRQDFFYYHECHYAQEEYF
jgi:RNA polymerase sigma-54 factor